MVILAGTLSSKGLTAVTPPITVVSVVAVIVAPITMVAVVVPTTVVTVDVAT
jgi:hypothetical protein